MELVLILAQRFKYMFEGKDERDIWMSGKMVNSSRNRLISSVWVIQFVYLDFFFPFIFTFISILSKHQCYRLYFSFIKYIFLPLHVLNKSHWTRSFFWHLFYLVQFSLSFPGVLSILLFFEKKKNKQNQVYFCFYLTFTYKRMYKLLFVFFFRVFVANGSYLIFIEVDR